MEQQRGNPCYPHRKGGKEKGNKKSISSLWGKVSGVLLFSGTQNSNGFSSVEAKFWKRTIGSGVIFVLSNSPFTQHAAGRLPDVNQYWEEVVSTRESLTKTKAVSSPLVPLYPPQRVATSEAHVSLL